MADVAQACAAHSGADEYPLLTLFPTIAELSSKGRQTGSSQRAAYCRAGQRRPIAQSVQREWRHRRSGLAAAARPSPMSLH